MWLSLAHPLLGTWPRTQAYALTGNQTGDPLVRRPLLNPLSYTSQVLTANVLCYSILALSCSLPAVVPSATSSWAAMFTKPMSLGLSSTTSTWQKQRAALFCLHLGDFSASLIFLFPESSLFWPLLCHFL